MSILHPCNKALYLNTMSQSLISFKVCLELEVRFLAWAEVRTLALIQLAHLNQKCGHSSAGDRMD